MYHVNPSELMPLGISSFLSATTRVVRIVSFDKESVFSTSFPGGFEIH